MLFDDMEDNEDDLIDINESKLSTQVEEAPKVAREQSRIIGHEAIEKILIDLVAAERFPSALIFNGAAGIGKATMAYRLARYLFKYKADEDDGGGLFGAAEPVLAAPSDSLYVDPADAIFQQVASGGYPDLLTIEREIDERGRPKAHDLDQVRDITKFFRRTSSQGGWRIAIIDDADTMNRYSQNALLKILEEPPKKSLLILISHRIGSLLPTILSRAQVLNFQALDEAQLRRVAGSALSRYEDATQRRLVRMADGSVSQALLYAETECCEIIERTAGLLQGWPNLDWSAIQYFADAIGAKGSAEAGQTAFRDFMLHVAHGLAKAKSLGTAHEFQQILDVLSLKDALDLNERLKAHFDQVQYAALDRRFMVMGAFHLLGNMAKK